MRIRIWKRSPRIGTAHAQELEAARKRTAESRRRARDDLVKQRALLSHENKTVTGPLRDERVNVNHLSVLAQQALWGR